ncbi:hypothetical protein HCG49_00930 [Arenibacter sp. 6A1]|uniref:hypothetical protein n=1 Tax=Arenibacter sp. 6A1 TaxID=2720391 RepID=UPI001444E90A|nr:hypothetical protein [Arenibacter sp. 6A1]NKI25121.1 hypothetical protein [Arenibacter sp. 6A1]
MIKTLLKYGGFLLFVFFTAHIQGQQFLITQNGYPVFSSQNNLDTGVTQSNQISIQIINTNNTTHNNNHLLNPRVTVRLLDSFRNTSASASSIGPNIGQLSFNMSTIPSQGVNINPQHTSVSLSLAEQVLLVGNDRLKRDESSYVFYYNLDISSDPLLNTIPDGSYRATYEFKLYDGTTLLKTVQVIQGAGFDKNMAQTESIVLQNAANLLNFQFSTASDYTGEKSIDIQNGLKVTSINNYQITVKASNSDFISHTQSTTFPVSVLKVVASKAGDQSNVAFNGPLQLSTSNQTLITRSANIPQTLEYNLRFFMPPNSIQNSVERGDYTTDVTFSLVPN